MYRVFKDHFVITFQKMRQGIILTFEHQDVKNQSHTFSLVNGEVYKLVKDKWEIMDTEELKHDRSPSNGIEKGAFNLIKVLLYYPFNNKYLKLTRDELFFLQALAYDLLISEKPLHRWLPIGNEFFLFGDELEIFYNGRYHTFQIPSSVNISLPEYLSRPIKQLR